MTYFKDPAKNTFEYNLAVAKEMAAAESFLPSKLRKTASHVSNVPMSALSKRLTVLHLEQSVITIGTFIHMSCAISAR